MQPTLYMLMPEHDIKESVVSILILFLRGVLGQYV